MAGPEDLLVNEDGSPRRIDKAYSWDAPIAAHGLMHTVITNAANKDPYGIDVLFMYMANMGWNSTMNTNGIMDHLTKIDEETGDYVIPKFIYSDAYYSETVAYADLILPDTTYLERWDCISMLDRPISEPHGPADSIRQPVVEPDRDVRPFQTVMLDLGARLGLPGMVKEDMTPKYPGGYSDYIVNHERGPGIGPLAGFRGADGSKQGIGEVNPNQLDDYIKNGCFWKYDLPEHMRYYRMANKDYLEWAQGFGFNPNANQIMFNLYSETMQKFRQAARGHGDIVPPQVHRRRVEAFFDPVPMWYAPFEEAMTDAARIPDACHHPAAHGDVSFMGLAECLAAPDSGPQLALHGARQGQNTGPEGRRLGACHQPSRPHQGAVEADGRGEPGHGLDLECHRQAVRGLEPRQERAGSQKGLPAQPHHLGPFTGTR